MSEVITACPVWEEFDPFGPDYVADPQNQLRRARRSHPVFYSPVLENYIVTRHEDVRAVFADPATFSPRTISTPVMPLCPAALAKLDEHGFDFDYGTLGRDEEPLHMQRRRKVAEPYSVKATAPWEPRARAVFSDYIDRFVKRGHADLVADLFWEAPAVVALEFMGLDEEEVAQAKQFAQGIMEFSFGRPSEEDQVAVCDLMGRHQNYSRRLIDKMIESPDGRGVLKYAVRAYLANPNLFDKNFLIGLAMLDLAAAHQTTSYGSTNAALLLLRNRGSWDELCNDASLITNAVEECLRYAAPLQSWRRYCVKDTTVGGVPIPAGANLLLYMGSANHDESVFEHPQRFDIRRKNAKRHVTFGYANHACMGAPLARMEIRLFVEELTRRLPHMRLVEGQLFEYVPTVSARAPKAIHVEWDPTQNPLAADRA